MVVKRTTSDTIREIKADVKVKRLKATFAENPLFQLPIDSLTTEALTFHKMRDVRRLNPQEPKFVEVLLKANAEDQRARSRLTEIIVECGRAISRLDKVLDHLTQYLLITYSLELKNYRTKEERMYVVGSVIKPFKDYLNSVESLRAAVQLIVVDIDKAAYSLKLYAELLKLHTKPEQFL